MLYKVDMWNISVFTDDLNVLNIQGLWKLNNSFNAKFPNMFVVYL